MDRLDERRMHRIAERLLDREKFGGNGRIVLPEDDIRDDEVFGKCANENWHGHNFELYVTIKGNPDPGSGFIFDAKKLGALINENVTEKLDHKNLNVDVDFMKGKMCTIENLVMAMWKELEPLLPPPVQLHCLKLVETAKI